MLRRDAAAVVGHRDAHVVAARDGEMHRAAVELAWTAFSSRFSMACWSSASSARTCRPGAGAYSMLTPLRARRGLDEPANRGDDRAHVEDVACRRLPARQPQEVLGDPAASQHLVAGNRGVLPDTRPIAVRVGHLRVPQDALDTREHRGQGRVELVREARREHAERREAVRLREPGLRRATLGDIPPDLHDLHDARPRRRVPVTRAPPPTRIPVGGVPLADAHLRIARREARQRGTVGHAAHARRRVAARAAEHVAAIAARASQKRGVRRDDVPLRVEHDDAIVDAVDDRLQPFALAAHLADQARSPSRPWC